MVQEAECQICYHGDRPDRETCPGGCEAPQTYAGVAICARDTSVGEMISAKCSSLDNKLNKNKQK